jgi:hypothetical protein
VKVNFKEEILEALAERQETAKDVIGFVVEDGKILWYSDPDPRDIREEFINVKLSWENHSYLLNYETDNSYGVLDCHKVRIYTADRIFIINEYDGCHSIISIPKELP